MSGFESASVPLFPLSRWREAYDRDEVDTFVQRVRTDPAGISANQVRDQLFTPSRWAKAGYDVMAVDAYLDAVLPAWRQVVRRMPFRCQDWDAEPLVRLRR